MRFNDILLKGILSQNGMASFSNSLSAEDVEAIHHYLINQQSISYGKEQGIKNK
jgi:quinohemoprotein ethanol dehydrogenase